MQNVAILGATGSIGKSTLGVLELYPDKFRLYAVTAHSRVKELAEIAKRFNVSLAVTSDPSKLEALKEAWRRSAAMHGLKQAPRRLLV